MDEELVVILKDIHKKLRYGNRPCPHCGVMIVGDEPDLTFSAGGKYLPEYGVAAHGTCFYRFEATDEWRAQHPEYKPAKTEA